MVTLQLFFFLLISFFLYFCFDASFSLFHQFVIIDVCIVFACVCVCVCVSVSVFVSVSVSVSVYCCSIVSLRSLFFCKLGIPCCLVSFLFVAV